jgi:hypothetical protein
MNMILNFITKYTAVFLTAFTKGRKRKCETVSDAEKNSHQREIELVQYAKRSIRNMGQCHIIKSSGKKRDL